MRRRKYFSNMKKLCNQLNALLPIKEIGDKDRLNALLYEMQTSMTDSPRYEMYWDREIYIDFGFDFEKMKAFALHSGKVQFEPNEDATEHPGVVIRYKSNTNQ